MVKNGSTADRVVALFDCSPRCEVNGTILKQGTQLAFDLIKVKKRNLSRRVKGRENIDVAGRAEVIPEHRTKEFKLNNLPLLAED